MDSRKRMQGADRKQSILEAARPLFADNGFNGTSVRDIARAADVSEALLYKHFESKEELYDETMDYAATVSSAILNRPHDLRVGAEELVAHIYFIIRLILTETPMMADRQQWHERLLFRSLLGDGKYARNHFLSIEKLIGGRINVCFEAAVKEGDLIENAIGNRNRMWFSHHLGMALNLCHMSDEPAFEYEGTKEELVEQAVLFCLRGIGLTEAAVNRYFLPQKLKEMFERVYG